jgi:3-carboxy-cis,cis-muconate cycloisomerase
MLDPVLSPCSAPCLTRLPPTPTAPLPVSWRWRSAIENLPLAGRTWLQHALPIPLGLKLAGYAGALGRSRTRLARVRRDALVLQFGGAAETLAALGDTGLAVAQPLAAELGLGAADAPRHSHRDRLAKVAAALAIMAGTCGKIARDVTLLMQTDVPKAFEPAGTGRGVSSTMRQKRNQVGAVAALAAMTVFDPSAYQGVAQAFIDRLIALARNLEPV